MTNKRERGTGGLFKLANSRFWYAQVYRDGRPCRISTKCEVKQEAQAFLRNLLVEADLGRPFQGDVKKIRYGDLRAALLQNYTERGNKSLLVDGDGNEFINGLKALDDFFGFKADDLGVSITKMTTDAARDFAKQRLNAGVTNSTVNNSLALLRRMLRIAHEDRKLDVVPVIRLLKANPARRGFLSREKFDELVTQFSDNLKPLVTFLYYCGVRLGEALQVEWSQVDLKATVIRLEDEQTKTGEARIVPLPDVLVTMLEQIKDRSGRVFDSKNLRKEWMKACTAVGLGTMEPVDKSGNRRYTGLIMHDMRRSAIKNLLKMGVNEKVAMAISGHKTRAVFDRYHIVDAADVLEAMRKVQGRSVSESSVKVLPQRKRLSA